MKGHIENLHNVSPTLHRIANTILCNYSMTTTPNLVNGRMGVCLFLYEYARLTGIKEYEDIADDMIDLILKILHKGQNEENISSLSGIGVGVIYLITHQFLEDTDEHDSLEEVDKFLQKTIETSKVPSEMVVQSALYFIYRYVHYRDGHDKEYYYRLAGQLVKLFQNQKGLSDDDSKMWAYILQNATFIQKTATESEDFRCEHDIAFLETLCPKSIEQITAENMWYSILFGNEVAEGAVDERNLNILCRNCFYDADRVVGILCSYGLMLMNRNN